MPVTCEVNIIPISKDEFYDIDYKFMNVIFNVHNKIGCFCKEKTYQEYLCKLSNQKFDITSEIPIKVSYNDFEKHYFIDILVDGKIIYELRAAESLNNEYQRQLMHYLMLTELHHGKLINFGRSSVQHRFVICNLNNGERHNLIFHEQYWNGYDDDSRILIDMIKEIISDWGGFLDVSLYTDAVVHFLGGDEKVYKMVDLFDDEQYIGNHKLHLLNDKAAFKITGITKYLQQYILHLIKLLKLTRLDSNQWVNFNRNKIEFPQLINNHLVINYLVGVNI